MDGFLGSKIVDALAEKLRVTVQHGQRKKRHISVIKIQTFQSLKSKLIVANYSKNMTLEQSFIVLLVMEETVRNPSKLRTQISISLVIG